MRKVVTVSCLLRGRVVGPLQRVISTFLLISVIERGDRDDN